MILGDTDRKLLNSEMVRNNSEIRSEAADEFTCWMEHVGLY
jgi:hypothetical protein